MQDMATLSGEIQALRREVRGQRRRQRRSLIVAVVALVIAAISPIAAFAANPFTDLDPAQATGHNPNIDAIYTAGITTGCFPDRYCPKDFVTREQMASFLARTAGVGNNPPVTNARTVGGFTANALSRVNGASQGNTPLPVLTSFNEYTAVTIQAPGPGFVYLTGSVTVYAASSGQAFVTAILVDPASGFGSFPQSTAVGTTSGTTFAATISPTVVLQVPTAGPRTYVFLIGKDPAATGVTGATSATISALFVPFGPGGAIGAEVGPAWPTPSEPPARPQP